jgi:hypothetical protein
MAKHAKPIDDVDYYSDDPDGFNKQPQKKKLPAVLAFLLLLVGGSYLVQTTLAANISINSGSNFEFGQGVLRTTACDNAILVTPTSTFVNAQNAGSHKFAGVSLSAIDSNSGKCSGKDFIIKAYSSSGVLMNIFSNNGQSYNTLRVYDNAGNFYLVSAGSDLDVISGGSTANLNDTSFTVTFDTPIAAADEIEYITVESVEHVDTGIIYYGSSSYQLVSNEISWQAAYLDITTPVDGQCKYRRNGQCGYFAAITSDAERQAVVSSVGDSQMWLGGSDIQEEGIWKWIDGPQFGTLFSAGYTNWAGGEPNDSGNEDALQTYSGINTEWNDLPVGDGYNLKYLIEYSPDFRSRTNRLLPTYYDVGDTGPAGGKIFYYSAAGFNCGSGFNATGSPTGGKCHFLEVALTTGASAWTDVSRSWATGGNQSASVTGARETAIGSGYKNSLAIEAQSGNVAATSAAVAARAYRGGSKSDWYLPSQDELLQLQANKSVADLSGFSFWSSTENDATTAKDLGNNQSPGNGNKASVTPVRPIRAF